MTRGLHVKKNEMIYESECDICRQTYYTETKAINQKCQGYPVYLVCAHCFLWSVPNKRKKYARLIQGHPWKPPTSGKQFSKKWVNVYGRPRVLHSVGLNLTAYEPNFVNTSLQENKENKEKEEEEEDDDEDFDEARIDP